MKRNLKIAIKRAQRKACLPLLSGSDLCKKLVRLKNNMAEKVDGIKLKPCPFCGGEAKTEEFVKNFGPTLIECSKCGAMVTFDKDEINKWNGSYGIQAYQSKVTLKNISVTGADGGILVNGAEVVLEGVVDVSGNEFGGIEVSKGYGVESMPKLIGSAENLKNDTEEDGKPTV